MEAGLVPSDSDVGMKTSPAHYMKYDSEVGVPTNREVASEGYMLESPGSIRYYFLGRRA